MSLWIEDFSEVKRLLDALGTTDAAELRRHFERDPELLARCVGAVRVIDVNQATLDLHGASSKAELLGSLEQTFTESSLGAFREELIDLATGATSTNQEGGVRSLRGELLEVMARISIDPSYPDWSRVYVAIVDLTAHKRTESDLRLSELLLEMSESVSAVGGWMLEYADASLHWTPEAKRILGPEAEGIATGPQSLTLLQPAHAARLAAAVEHAFEAGEPYELDLRLRDRDGAERWCHTRGRPIFEDGRPVRLYGTLEDITEKRAAEQEQLRFRAQVLQAEKLQSLSVLAGGIAHDFNNILMAVLGNVNLALLDQSLAPSVRENLLAIEKASQRAAGLSRQMLAYSGRGRFTIEPLSLNDKIRELLPLLVDSLGEHEELSLELDAKLPVVEVDPNQIRQLIVNLIENASESFGGRPGTITIRTGIECCDRVALASTHGSFRDPSSDSIPEGDYVYMDVIDTGCGMSAEIQERIFDPFFTTKFTGRGLGLAAVLGILRGHSGAIRIHSDEGLGTRMRVLLPVTDQEVVLTPQPAGVQREPADRRHVLVIDDEDSVRKIAQAMIERMGFQVSVAAGGAEALEMIEQLPDLACVLVDLTMPRMDGHQTFVELRKLRPDLPVVLLSGYDESDATARFLPDDLAGFLQKPFAMQSLRAILDGLVRTVEEARADPTPHA